LGVEKSHKEQDKYKSQILALGARTAIRLTILNLTIYHLDGGSRAQDQETCKLAMMPKTEIVRVERKVLRALCQGSTEGPIREFGCAMLRQYHWRDPIHQIIFEALMSIPSEYPEIIRTELPTRLTRMGFPDLAWEDLFAPGPLSKAEAERLVKALSESCAS
jgi:hypothetical protein